MKIFKNRHRIVIDDYAGFEAQIKFWWFPFCWFQGETNTWRSVEQAKEFIANGRKINPRKGKVVWQNEIK